MTIEVYNEKIANLKKKLKLDTMRLIREYVLANNPYKVGDIIADGSKKIRIATLKFSQGMCGSPPQAVFFGIRINKDGSDSKRGDREVIYQSNIIK